MRQSQRGITFIGWLFLIVPVGICLYGAIRLTPIYLNYLRVSRAMSGMVEDAKGGDLTNREALRVSLYRRFEVDSIEHPNPKEVDIHRDGDHWAATVDYEEVAPLFGNISILVQFHKDVSVH